MVNGFKYNLFASKLPKWLIDSTTCFLGLTQSNTFKLWPVTEFHTLSLPAGVYEMYSEHLQSQGNQVTVFPQLKEAQQLTYCSTECAFTVLEACFEMLY